MEPYFCGKFVFVQKGLKCRAFCICFLKMLSIGFPKNIAEWKFFSAALLKRDANTGAFLCKLRNFEEKLFYRTPPVAASELNNDVFSH